MTALDPQPMRRIVDLAMAPTRRWAPRLFLPAALPLVAVTLATVLVQARWLEGLSSPNPDLGAVMSGLGSSLLALGLLIVVSGLTHGVLTVGAADALAGRPVRAWAGWAYVLQPSVLGTWLIGASAVVVSFLCCVAPILWVMPVSRFLMPVMVDEGRRGMDAVRRAVALAHGRPAAASWLESPWTKMAGVMIAGYAAAQGLTLVVQLPVAIIQQYTALRTAAGGESDPAAILAPTLGLQAATATIATVLSTAAAIYAVFAEVAWVREVRRRREGEDLEAALAAIDGAVGEGLAP